MPTQRPFLANFLAVFRAHPQPLPKPSTAASAQTIWTSSKTNPSLDPSNPNSASRAIAHKSNHYSTSAVTAASAAAVAATASDRQILQHNVSAQTHLPRSSAATGTPPAYGPQNRPAAPSYPTPQESHPWSSARRARRGSDSSSDSGGFREVRGPAAGEKWFVGGRTSSGEEKYYALSKIRRDRSSDRISTDQMSL